MENEQTKEHHIKTLDDLDLGGNDFNPNTALGQYRFLILIFLLILFTVIVFVCLRFLGFYEHSKGGNNQFENPIFSDINDQPDVSVISGMKVYDALEDVDEIEKDAAKRNEEFYGNINSIEESGQKSDKIEIMKQRDSFAAEKLEFLKKIDNAKTKEERQKLIRQLREKVTVIQRRNKQ